MKTPDPTKAESSALNSVNITAPARFTGTDNPRHLRTIQALMTRPITREHLDQIAGCSNGPELVAELRRRGLEVPCCRTIKPSKLNLPGCPVQGWHTVGELRPGGVAHICEGIGQAWACWQQTGQAAVVCFGWGRVRSVAAELRARDASARLVLVVESPTTAHATTPGNLVEQRLAP